MDEISGQNMWKNIGPLLAIRGYHRSIIVKNTILHIGGANGGSGVMWVYPSIENTLFQLK